MSKGSSKQIVIASATTLVVGAFGAGAFALAQADPSFDPRDFASAYSRGYEDAAKGYEANPIEADAQANRNKDDAENDDSAAGGQHESQDAFSSAPQDGPTGTTAYNITGNADQGGISIANGNGTGGAGGSSSAGGANGAVIAPTGSSEGGNAATGGSGSSGASADEPSTPGAGGTDQPDDPGTPDDPWVDPLPDDPTPNKSGDSLYEPVNDSNTKLTGIMSDTVVANINPADDEYTKLYVGQKIDAWKVFCALEANFMGLDADFNLVTGEWRCSYEQFSDYPYFKIVSFPEIVPAETFDIEVAWRLRSDDEWRYETVSYDPSPSRTYILSTKLDENGDPVILPYPITKPINLFFYTASLMESTGIKSADGTLSKMLLSWTEGGEDVEYIYNPEPGRHVIVPGKLVDVPDGYTVKLRDYWLNADYSIAPTGGYACGLQTLASVDGSASCMLVPDRFGRITLSLPKGIQAVDIEPKYSGPLMIDRLELTDTVWYVNTSNGLLRVNDGYSVPEGNPNYASLQNGILTDKKGSEYLGVPFGFTSLDVPEGIESVNFTPGNKLSRVTLNAAHVDEIPSANWDALTDCTIYVDDAAFDAFASANRGALDISTGNRLAKKSDPQTTYCYSNDSLISDDAVVQFVDTGVDLVRVADAHRIAAGSLDNCPNIKTIVLTDRAPYTFDEGCLDGSNVRTIVCSTDEQANSVYAYLQEAGLDEDVIVAVASTTDEGYRFFAGIDDDGFPTSVVFEVPDSTRTFNGVGMFDDDGIAFSAIAPGTFEDHPNLEWVDLADSVDSIGADAFNGCQRLQGVFIANENSITVGVNAFANCPNLRFVASNAMDGEFASNERPNADCLMYAPTGCTGYHDGFTSFTADSNVSCYSVDVQDDGSFVLYGSNDDQGMWLLLAAGGELYGEVSLSSDTIEIFEKAFEGTQGDFTVNWNELARLQYVDAEAFAYSSLAGDVYIGSPWTEFVYLDDSAFASCPNITSFASDAGLMRFGDSVFAECGSLESARFSANDNGYTMSPGQFSGCTNLRTLEFGGYDPIKIGLYAQGLPFLFDSMLAPEEEAAKLHLEVPVYYQETYLEKWLYSFAGYMDYDDLYFALYMQMINESDVVPTDTQVKQRMSQVLLTAENRLRTMMGMPLVERSSFVNAEEKDGYTFNMIDGVDTLVSAPEDATVSDLAAVIPDSLSTVAIGENAFSACANLQRVIVPDKVSAIQTGAFNGCDDVTVQLPETVGCSLAGGTVSDPFTFGSEIKLDVPADAQSAYLAAWTKQCLGILSDDDLSNYALAALYDNWDVFAGELPTADELNEKVNEPFVAQENYLRSLMGLDQIDGTDELTFYYDASDLLAWFAPWGSWSSGFMSLDKDGETLPAAALGKDGEAASEPAGDAPDAGGTAAVEGPIDAADERAGLAAKGREEQTVEPAEQEAETTAQTVVS